MPQSAKKVIYFIITQNRNVRLNEGDIVTIVTDPDILPDISWFESAVTGMATKYLVDHFSKRENLVRLL